MHSWTTQVPSRRREENGDVARTLVLVELDEGFRAMADFVGCSGEPKVGLRVEVTWQRVEDGLTLPQFRALSGGAV
ncbi:OB-fold domain-containing protein [Nocardioidaceae bacterium SCSIO 66511]|nr:OB-fold domain-containing protein [Nocardioidaceae bacterium SCSIO 66511]